MSAALDLPAYFQPELAPATAKLLGWRFERCDEAEGVIEVTFDASPDFANPAGHIQGGMLAAMLDDTMSPAVLIRSRGTVYAPTIQMNLQYLRPVAPGRVRAEGRCVQLGRTIAHMEGVLFNTEGDPAVKATATARVVPLDKVRAS